MHTDLMWLCLSFCEFMWYIYSVFTPASMAMGWLRHEDVMKWKYFRVTGLLWGESTGHRWIPLTKASDHELSCFIYLCLNKRLSKHSRRWWFETPSRSLWCHCNGDYLSDNEVNLHDMGTETTTNHDKTGIVYVLGKFRIHVWKN